MKRVLSIAVVCIVLFTLSGLSVFAQGGTPDVTPPVVYAVGVSPTTDPIKGCPGNVPVKVQAKVTDLGGVAGAQATVKAPGGATTGWPMALAADGYWHVWVPKTLFATKGTWSIRVEAWDHFSNRTVTGWKTVTITQCDKTPPTIEDLTWTPNEIVASYCDGIKNILVQANVWDASGIKKVELWYQAPTAAGWAVVNMAHYSNLGYQASIGNFPSGTLTFHVKAFDPFNHTTTTADQPVTVAACP